MLISDQNNLKEAERRACIEIEALHEMIDGRDADIARLTKANASMVEVCKHYANQYCEGWCKESGGIFPDCGGCPARAVLEQPI